MSDEPIPPVTPAVHTDRLWDVDKLPNGELTNLAPDPIPAKDLTKQDFFKLLSDRGLRMKHQQESVIGPEPDFEAMAAQQAAALAAAQQIVPPQPFNAHSARILQAHEAVLARYGLIETLGCDVCWQAKRPSGCCTLIDDHGVSIKCRCGTRIYRAPTGTTDQTQTFSKPTINDETRGMLFDAHGHPTSIPTILLDRQDADIIRAYVGVLHRYRLSRTLFCRLCCGGRYAEDTAIQASVTPDQIVYVCRCRLRFTQT